MMKIITLLENNTSSKELKCAHGLSLYIEANDQKILFDTGPNNDFYENGLKLGIDFADIDVAILSHGHYDHGGGLKKFLEVNQKAKIYAGEEAFQKHFVKIAKLFSYDIGVDPKLLKSKRFVLINETTSIDKNLTLFANIQDHHLMPAGNSRLLMRDENNKAVEDNFSHEINLIIKENDNLHLICGCAHRGVVNIINAGQKLVSKPFKTVVGGFHLRRLNSENKDDRDFLDMLVLALKASKTERFITGHCTGKNTVNYLQSKMANIQELSTGLHFDML